MIYYFDNCATTRTDDDVTTILDTFAKETYYNPSARSTFSLQVSNKLNEAREQIAKLVGADPSEIYFTSGGTESDNIAIFGSAKPKSGNIVVTASEHSAVYNAVMQLGSKGYEVRLTNVTDDGHIDVADFLSKVDDKTVLACFMHVNNETGAINDVKQINASVKAKNPRTVTLSDGVQAVGKVPVNLHNLGVDFYSMSGHKIHGSKGTGFLYAKKGARFTPIVFGGGQENGMRSGTEYVGGQIALATALKKATSLLAENAEKYATYKQIIRNALADIPDWRENCTENCSPAIMSLAFADIKGEVLLHMLEAYDIIVGTGSACSSKNKQSRIAKAIRLNMSYVEGIIRISFSKYNDLQQVQKLAVSLATCVKQLRKTMLGK